MRSGSDKHLSNSLTFVAPDFASYSEDSRPPSGPCPTLHIDNTTDPMCPHFPDSQAILANGEEPHKASLSPSLPQQQSKYKTRQFDRHASMMSSKKKAQKLSCSYDEFQEKGSEIERI